MHKIVFKVMKKTKFKEVLSKIEKIPFKKNKTFYTKSY